MSTSKLETIHLEHLPSSYDAHVSLFRNLKNAEYLQKQLLEGNNDFEYALLDASVIISRTHILSAVYRAVNDLIEDRLRTRNVHSEIVFSLSPNNNIAASFRTFGVVPSTKGLILIKVTTPATPEHTAESIQSHIVSAVEGEQVPFSDENLASLTDWTKVKKIYKLSGLGNPAPKKPVNGAVSSTPVEEKKELEVAVLGSMALRGATN